MCTQVPSLRRRPPLGGPAGGLDHHGAEQPSGCLLVGHLVGVVPGTSRRPWPRTGKRGSGPPRSRLGPGDPVGGIGHLARRASAGSSPPRPSSLWTTTSTRSPWAARITGPGDVPFTEYPATVRPSASVTRPDRAVSSTRTSAARFGSARRSVTLTAAAGAPPTRRRGVPAPLPGAPDPGRPLPIESSRVGRGQPAAGPMTKFLKLIYPSLAPLAAMPHSPTM